MYKIIYMICRICISQAVACLLINWWLVFSCVSLANAFNIEPAGIAEEIEDKKPEQKHPIYGAIIRMFKDPVHERATNITYGCEDDPARPNKCGRPEDRTYAPPFVIAGNQWNDNPMFIISKSSNPICEKYIGDRIQLPAALLCWLSLFYHGMESSGFGTYYDIDKGYVTLYRAHFGDMQFMHAMAGMPSERAKETRKLMMMWAEFTYRLAIDDLDRTQEVREVEIDGMKELFHRFDWKAEYLFTRGDKMFPKKKDFQDFVFGSLLHLVQDSFTASHVERDKPKENDYYVKDGVKYHVPGSITMFYCYAGQDISKHSAEDSQKALTEHLQQNKKVNCVTVGKVLKEFYERKAPWTEVKEYLECVFTITEQNAASGPGRFLDESKIAESREWNTDGQEE